MDINKLIQTITTILFVSAIAILLSGCATTNKEVVYAKPIVVTNTHTIERKVVLPDKPVCSIDDNLLTVNWYALLDMNSNKVNDIYILTMVDMHSLSYNINEIRDCIKLYKTYINTIEKIIYEFNNNNDNESTNIQ